MSYSNFGVFFFSNIELVKKFVVQKYFDSNYVIDIKSLLFSFIQMSVKSCVILFYLKKKKNSIFFKRSCSKYGLTIKQTITTGVEFIYF